jgi:hypothetical protein
MDMNMMVMVPSAEVSVATATSEHRRCADIATRAQPPVMRQQKGPAYRYPGLF